MHLRNAQAHDGLRLNRARHRRGRPTWNLERLEDRTLLATIDLDAAGLLTYTAAAGEVNMLSVSLNAAVYSFDDPGNVITLLGLAAVACVNVDLDTVECDTALVNQMSLSMDDMSDRVNLLVPGSPSTTVMGGAGDDVIQIVPATTAAVIDGGPGSDGLIGPNGGNTFHITGMDAGNLSLGATTFTSIEDLSGGNGDDNFVFANGAAVSGLVEGVGGTDTLDLSAYTSPRTILLQGLDPGGVFFGDAPGVVGQSFFTMESVIGGFMNDTLRGRNVAANWSIDGTNTYTAGGQTLAFSSFENLEGGTNSDVFLLADGVVVPGTVDGRDGNDTLSYGYTTPVTVNLLTGEASGIRAGFVGSLTSIETVLGGAGSDVIVGQNVAQRLMGGPGNDTITGGTADDTVLGEAGNDVLRGGGGTDWVLFTGSPAGVKFNLQKGKATGEGTDTAVGFRNAIGSPFADQLTGTVGANILAGGAGNDTIKGGLGDDVLLGGAGNDLLSDKGGRNILIGGADADILIGGTGEDILIAGTTPHEMNDAALAQLAAEWSTLLRPYATRIQNLRDGTGSAGALNGASFLTAATVADDGAVDRLAGKKSLDWFFGRTAVPTLDVLVDRVLATETADAI
jgi:Ca2+-binding RTX toxin-like protein